MGSESRYFGLWKVGNTKLSLGTLVFNMSSATDCPSKARSLCRIPDLCYACNSECRWKAVLPFRRKQQKYWDKYGVWEMLADIKPILKKCEVSYFRYNEAGDFKNQRDVDLLDLLADRLKYDHGIITYGYTARSDLNFKNHTAIIRGSGWMGPNGQTNVLHKKFIKGRKTITFTGSMCDPSMKGVKYKVCPMEGCGTKCKACMKETGNIIFPLHGNGR